jgi:hypothetical protein
MAVPEQVELGHLVLKRFLLLALLLDRAVSGQPGSCPAGTPLLFRRGQPLKSSAEARKHPASLSACPLCCSCTVGLIRGHQPLSNPSPCHHFAPSFGLARCARRLHGLHAHQLLPDLAPRPPEQAVEHFLRGRMRGEGDVMRHLGALGFRLRYEQDPRTEFDFGVANLGTDLRSGVRLLRLAELLTGAKGFAGALSPPTPRHADFTDPIRRLSLLSNVSSSATGCMT